MLPVTINSLNIASSCLLIKPFYVVTHVTLAVLTICSRGGEDGDLVQGGEWNPSAEFSFEMNLH